MVYKHISLEDIVRRNRVITCKFYILFRVFYENIQSVNSKFTFHGPMDKRKDDHKDHRHQQNRYGKAFRVVRATGPNADKRNHT